MPKVATPEQGFKLDKFQEEAIEHIRAGKSVIVCAPTGSGKTLIAKEAIGEAIKSGHKSFYTAPLKALINQKYHEFCVEYGEAKVGILTGDTSRNRDAQVIVMTTEIYRNMLYGTTFGSLDPYLKDLKFVIFDEFHYINDSNKKTVWEKNLIYNPNSVQVVGLSATINNPQELISWIRDIHGDCELVETHERPVPLHYFYFKEDQLAPLLTPNGKLNPKLKERNDNRFNKNGGRFGNRSSYSSSKPAAPEQVVRELHNKKMLPAIFFVFSRKGCDSNAKVCGRLNLLSKEEEKELNTIIDINLRSNVHIKNHPQLDLLRKGVASHHAGLLPQWKALVEQLFTQSLVKVVFSTETLSAGINMPARATVISNISKASDEGHRNLKSSEFMQMSGRAGRRGMDEAGYVITIKTNHHSAGEVALLANSKPEDVTSHFTASYEMVLNLLQNHDYQAARNLVEKSFGQSLANKGLHPLKSELKNLEKKLVALQSPLCPAEIGDLNYYRQMQSKLDETRSKKKELERKMVSGVEELEEMLEILTLEAQNYPCNGCPKQKPCSKQMSQVRRFKKQIKELNSLIAQRKNVYWEEFQKIVDLLKEKKYLDAKHSPTELGKICASIRSDNSFLITEVLQMDIFDKLNPGEFAATLSSLIIDENRGRDAIFVHASPKVFDAFKEIQGIGRKVLQSQRSHKIDKPVEINTHLAPIIEEWSRGVAWDDLMKNTNLDDGDILKGLRRTIDITKQLIKAPNLNPKIYQLAKKAIELLEREPVLETL